MDRILHFFIYFYYRSHTSFFKKIAIASGKRVCRSKMGMNLYPFGSPMPGRQFNSSSYKYGFNGKENDPETGTQDYGARIYNPSLGKFLSVDPLASKYAFYSPYHFAGNKPIVAVDVDGGEDRWIHTFEQKDGSYINVRDGSEILNDTDKEKNAAMFVMPSLKEGGMLITVTKLDGSMVVKQYIPDVIVKPGIMSDFVHLIKHPTEPIKEALNTFGNAADGMLGKMKGSMDNYGTYDGVEGMYDGATVLNTEAAVLKFTPLASAGKYLGYLADLLETVADYNTKSKTEATENLGIRVGLNGAGELIGKGIEKVLPNKAKLQQYMNATIDIGLEELENVFTDMNEERHKKADQPKK